MVGYIGNFVVKTGVDGSGGSWGLIIGVHTYRGLGGYGIFSKVQRLKMGFLDFLDTYRCVFD